MLETRPRELEILHLLEQKREGLTTREIMAISKITPGTELPDSITAVSPLLYYMREKDHTVESKKMVSDNHINPIHIITEKGLSALGLTPTQEEIMNEDNQDNQNTQDDNNKTSNDDVVDAVDAVDAVESAIYALSKAFNEWKARQKITNKAEKINLLRQLSNLSLLNAASSVTINDIIGFLENFSE